MIRCAIDGGLWTITIDRADKAGALTRDMLVELSELAEKATVAKVVVLTGTGRVFSAGADLDEARAGLAVDPIWERLSAAIAALPGLTVAALNGTVAGGAFGMVLACDLRVAVPTAKFFYPVMKLGFLPQPSDPKRMAHLIGPSKAKMILMAGQKITATQAHDWGLIDQVTAEADLAEAVSTLVQDALNADANHVLGIKSLVQ